MSTKTQTFTTSGTFTAPATLLGGSVTLDLRGGEGKAGGGADGGAGGKGARVQGTYALAPGAKLAVTVPYAAGGAGGTSTYEAGGAGGGAAAVQTATPRVLKALAGGGGGGGGGAGPPQAGGAGGSGGPTGSPGAGGAASPPTTGGPFGGGGGGAGSQTADGAGGSGGAAGTTGQSAVTGGTAGTASAGSAGGAGAPGLAGYSAGGGGGGGGYHGGGGGGSSSMNRGLTPPEAAGGGGGGGGGSSYAGGLTTALVTAGYQTGTPLVVVSFVVADPPNVPTLVAPANGSHSAASPLQFVYNPGTNSGSLSKWAVRRKTGTTPFEYWTATTATWKATLVELASALLTHVNGTEWSYAFPAAAWVTGATYSYSVATWESSYGLGGTFAATASFTNLTTTRMVFTSPPTVAETATPTVAWTSNVHQSGYVVKVYPQAVTARTGFNPAVTGTWVFDTGTVASTAKSLVVPASAGLTTGSWVVYGQVTTAGTRSGWKSKAFSVVVDSPATPSVTATQSETATSKMPTILLTVDGADNLLSAEDSSFEAGVGTWAGPTNATVARAATEAKDGSYSLAVKATAAGNAYAASGHYALSAGATYSVMASLRAKTTGRQVRCSLVFLNAATGEISQVDAPFVLDSTAAWVTCSVSGVAPAGTVAGYVQVLVETAAATEVHFVDCAGVFPGTPATWSLGGFVGHETVDIQASTDTGATWASLFLPVTPMGSLPQQANVTDYSAPNGIARQYRARLLATSGGLAVASAWSVPVTAPVLPNARWWIVDLLKPETAIGLSRGQSMLTIVYGTTGRPSIVETRNVAAGYFSCLGRDTYVKVADVVKQPEFNLIMDFFGTKEWNDFMVLWMANQVTGHTMLVKSDVGGELYWVTFGATRPTPMLRAADRVTNPTRQTNIHCYPVPALV